MGDDTASPGYEVASDGSFGAPLELAYPYARTVGPTYQRFLEGLAAGQLLGTRADDGSVVVPAGEFDPFSGAPLTEWVEVGPEGTVVAWTWEPSPDESSPLSEPFAWVLVRPDGADTAMVHACAASGPDAMSVGMRVQARFAAGATPQISALECFEPTGGTAQAGNRAGNQQEA